MTFIFRNRTIFWDILKWNRGQKKWDGGSINFFLKKWGFWKIYDQERRIFTVFLLARKVLINVEMHAHKAALITRQGGSISSRYFNKNQCTNELFFLVLERPQQTRLHLLNTEFQVNIQVFPTSCKGQTFQANWFGATRDASTLYIIYTII